MRPSGWLARAFHLRRCVPRIGYIAVELFQGLERPPLGSSKPWKGAERLTRFRPAVGPLGQPAHSLSRSSQVGPSGESAPKPISAKASALATESQVSHALASNADDLKPPDSFFGTTTANRRAQAITRGEQDVRGGQVRFPGPATHFTKVGTASGCVGRCRSLFSTIGEAHNEAHRNCKRDCAWGRPDVPGGVRVVDHPRQRLLVLHAGGTTMDQLGRALEPPRPWQRNRDPQQSASSVSGGVGNSAWHVHSQDAALRSGSIHDIASTTEPIAHFSAYSQFTPV